MAKQIINNSGEFGAVAPFFLTLKPHIYFNVKNNALSARTGIPTTAFEAGRVCISMVEAVKKVEIEINKQQLKVDFIPANLTTICMGQLITIAFTFKMENGILIVPPRDFFFKVIHRKLQQLNN